MYKLYINIGHMYNLNTFEGIIRYFKMLNVLNINIILYITLYE